jgi:PKD repeat protein
LQVQFQASGSSDPDGDALSYHWDFGDGAQSSARDPAHTYTVRGTYTARLTVSDGRGLSATDGVTIAVSTQPPRASISSPADGSLYRGGQSFQLQGEATDREDGVLPALAYRWTVLLHHGDHVHRLNSFTGVVSPSFTALWDHDADSYYEVTLTVTDSDGLTAISTIELRPETVGLTLDSEPRGAPISYSGLGGTAPIARVAAVGYRTTISAADRFVSGGSEWVFDHWSDDGERVHDITVPATAATFTAHYRRADRPVDPEAPPGGGPPGTPGTPPPADTTTPPPAPLRGRITVPARRAVVRGRITVRASVSGGVGVRRVRFRLDGRRLGRADSTAPFSVRWDTRTAKNGRHRLTALVRDAAGAKASSRTVPVIVRNTPRTCGTRPKPRKPLLVGCRLR